MFGATTVFGALLTRKLLEEGTYHKVLVYVINYTMVKGYSVAYLFLLPSLLFVLVHLLGYHVNGVIKSAKIEHHHFLHEGTVTG